MYFKEKNKTATYCVGMALSFVIECHRITSHADAREWAFNTDRVVMTTWSVNQNKMSTPSSLMLKYQTLLQHITKSTPPLKLIFYMTKFNYLLSK